MQAGRKRARPQKDSARDKLLTNKQVLISYLVHPVTRDMRAMQINHMLKEIGCSCNRVTVRPSICLCLTLLACFSFDHDVYFLLGASHNKYVPGSGCCCCWCLLWLHVACGMCCITRRLGAEESRKTMQKNCSKARVLKDLLPEICLCCTLSNLFTCTQYTNTDATTTNASTIPGKPNYRDYANREKKGEREATVKRTICAQRAQGEPELESDPTD